MIDAIIIIGIVAIFALTITLTIRNKKKGKTSCGCGCKNCAYGSSCKSKEQDDKKI